MDALLKLWLFITYNVSYVCLARSAGQLIQDSLVKSAPSVWTGVAGYAVEGGHVLHMVCDSTIAADNAIFSQIGPKLHKSIRDSPMLQVQRLTDKCFCSHFQSRDPLYIDDVETILDEGTLAFNLQIEDGSVEEVAEELMIMHEECLSGNFGSVERLREASHNPAAYPHAEQV
ncbi:hypothetical protein TSUD_137410 [Trifolium subterraneum]|uniref:Uncharacterized protein n=1 Tax=Trifolium subterraneum TaxID=3900 RepID=A0A2Z6P7C1_TRISU|nr:hypothetical protein TSUD_137410 [Trifolium subterraneum]